MNTQEESWLIVEEYAKKELLRSTRALERTAATIDQTNYLRGEIAVLRNILNLPNVEIVENIEYEDYT